MSVSEFVAQNAPTKYALTAAAELKSTVQQISYDSITRPRILYLPLVGERTYDCSVVREGARTGQISENAGKSAKIRENGSIIFSLAKTGNFHLAEPLVEHTCAYSTVATVRYEGRLVFNRAFAMLRKRRRSFWAVANERETANAR